MSEAAPPTVQRLKALLKQLEKKRLLLDDDQRRLLATRHVEDVIQQDFGTKDRAAEAHTSNRLQLSFTSRRFHGAMDTLLPRLPVGTPHDVLRIPAGGIRSPDAGHVATEVLHQSFECVVRRTDVVFKYPHIIGVDRRTQPVVDAAHRDLDVVFDLPVVAALIGNSGTIGCKLKVRTSG